MKTLLDTLAASLLCDFYKLAHRPMYPKGMEVVYSTWTPRATRMVGVDKVVAAGFQPFFKFLTTIFENNFFSQPVEKVVAEFERIIKFSLGDPNPDSSHIRALYKLGYLPLTVKALPEGTLVPLRTPVLTIHNTHPDFFWMTNYVESFASCEMWGPSNSATIANEYYKLLYKYAMETVGNADFVPLQGHDFSMRGMFGIFAAMLSGTGHLMSFIGTDTVPAIQAVEYNYGANIEKEMIGTSIPASEHSIQCTYEDDLEYFTQLISVVHPSGFVSIVSDGYDFWDVIGRVIPALKPMILARKGGPFGDKVVIRPDSGDPVLIVCGDPNGKTELERKGAIEALWDIFGGTVTEKGYKLLDSHIGLIYGDAITIARATEICERLKAKGFASINCVYGIGSFTYQYNTRDSLGFALKTTLVVRNGVERHIFKNPKTDDGTKKSLKGRVAVLKDGDSFKYLDQLGLNDVVEGDQLREIYRDGKMLVEETFGNIRARLAANRG